MSLLAFVSLAIAALALAWSLSLLKDHGDWRVGIVAGIAGLLALSQTLEITALNGVVPGVLAPGPGTGFDLLAGLLAFSALGVLTRGLAGAGSRLHVGTVEETPEGLPPQQAVRFQALIIEQMFDAVLGSDLENRIIEWNPAAERMFGYTREEVLGKTAAFLHDTDDADEFDEDILVSVKRGEMWTRELGFIHKDGSKGIRETVCFPVRDESGISACVSVSRDVTERKRAEEAEARLLEALNNIREGYALFDADDRLVLCNDRYGEFPEIATVVKPGTHFEDVMRAVAEAGTIPAALGREEAWIEERLAYHRNPEGVIEERVADGGWFQISEGRTRDGGTMTVVTDITQLKQREQAVRESEARLKTIIDHLPAIILLKDLDGRLRLVNRTYEETLGVAEANLYGKTAFDIFPPDEAQAFADQEQRIVTERRAVEREVVVSRPEGDRVYVTIKFPVFDAAGEVDLIGTVGLDITERKRSEERLRLAKEEAERADRAKSRFLAAASHDLRQPLHAMGLFLSLLGRSVEGNEPRALVEKIGTSLNALDRLLDSLLDISKLEAGVVTPKISGISMNHLLEMMAAEFAPQAHDKGLELRVVACDAVIRSDPTLLESVLRNLLSNAIRYTERDRVLLGCRRRGGMLRIEVWDTGSGIPESQIENAFREFQRLPQQGGNQTVGLGLGLTIVDRVSRLLGYRIEVQSTPGKGSMFAVTVPLQKHDAPARHAAASFRDEARGSLAGVTVAFIDNDADILEATHRLLRSWGCRVIAAESAAEVITRLSETDARPEILMADYHLHGTWTGVQAIAAVRANMGIEVPAILITGDTGPEPRRAAEEGGYGFLRKPFLSDPLYEVLLRSMGRAVEGRARPGPTDEPPVAPEAPARDGRRVTAG